MSRTPPETATQEPRAAWTGPGAGGAAGPTGGVGAGLGRAGAQTEARPEGARSGSLPLPRGPRGVLAPLGVGVGGVVRRQWGQSVRRERAPVAFHHHGREPGERGEGEQPRIVHGVGRQPRTTEVPLQDAGPRPALRAWHALLTRAVAAAAPPGAQLGSRGADLPVGAVVTLAGALQGAEA